MEKIASQSAGQEDREDQTVAPKPPEPELAFFVCTACGTTCVHDPVGDSVTLECKFCRVSDMQNFCGPLPVVAAQGQDDTKDPVAVDQSAGSAHDQTAEPAQSAGSDDGTHDEAAGPTAGGDKPYLWHPD